MTWPVISLKAKVKVRHCPDGDGMVVLPGYSGIFFIRVTTAMFDKKDS